VPSCEETFVANEIGSNWCLDLFLRALVNYYSSLPCGLHVASCKRHAICKGASNKNLELSTHASLILNHLNPNNSASNFNLQPPLRSNRQCSGTTVNPKNSVYNFQPCNLLICTNRQMGFWQIKLKP
jgi:hypothetical protein